MLEEKDKIYSELDVLRTEQNKIFQEKEKINIEKEKLLLLKQNNHNEIETLNNLLNTIELEKSSLQEKNSQFGIKFKKEKELLFEEKRILIDKNESLANEKILNLNELDFLRNQEKNTKLYTEKLELANRTLFSENQDYQIELEKLKFNIDNLQKSLKEKSSFIADKNEKIINFSNNSSTNNILSNNQSKHPVIIELFRFHQLTVSKMTFKDQSLLNQKLIH